MFLFRRYTHCKNIPIPKAKTICVITENAMVSSLNKFDRWDNAKMVDDTIIVLINGLPASLSLYNLNSEKKTNTLNSNSSNIPVLKFIRKKKKCRVLLTSQSFLSIVLFTNNTDSTTNIADAT